MSQPSTDVNPARTLRRLIVAEYAIILTAGILAAAVLTALLFHRIDGDADVALDLTTVWTFFVGGPFIVAAVGFVAWLVARVLLADKIRGARDELHALMLATAPDIQYVEAVPPGYRHLAQSDGHFRTQSEGDYQEAALVLAHSPVP